MYKTVRHGENSLQYTILPQQDEGAAVATRPAGRRHRKKGKTAAVLAVTIVLICGIIATAVLVPLLLTSDLVALPAAFQKFSVASMHTVRVGSHKEVVAKKPSDWRPHYLQVVTTTTTTTTPRTTVTPSTTTSTTTTPPPTTTQEKMDVVEITTLKSEATESATTTTTTPKRVTYALTEPPKHTHRSEVEWMYTLPSNSDTDTDRASRIKTEPPTTIMPWYKLPSFRWPIYRDSEKLLIPIIAGGGVVTLLIIVATIIWMKRRRSRRSRTILERVTADSQTADKENLLTDPAGMSDEEQ